MTPENADTMTAAGTANRAQRRRGVLDGIADERLAEHDAAEERQRERDAEAVAEAEQLARLGKTLADMLAQRRAAITRAEVACRELVKGLAEALKVGTEAARLGGAIGRHMPPTLSGASATRRLSECLSATFKPLCSGTRFGAVYFCNTWQKPDTTWE